MKSQVLDLAIPSGLNKLAGQMLDIDSHEMLPAQAWVEALGPIAEDLVTMWMTNGLTIADDVNHPNVPGYEQDDVPIDRDTIWQKKGAGAPGATDVTRRIEIMELMGISKQLMFPSLGLFCVSLALLDPEYGYGKTLKRDAQEYGRELVKAYNEWGIRAARVSSRIRPVLPVFADNVEDLMRTARYLIDNGIRGFWLPSDTPLGGKSPAHPDLDPFWELVTSNKVVCSLHVHNSSKIYGTDVWSDAPAFAGFRALGEFKLDPWSMANIHTPAQNFLTTMVLGGVFERHSDLRFGVIEIGAGWIGPLCDTLDLWYSQDPTQVKKNAEKVSDEHNKPFRLERRPSEYIKRNVRASTFDFEPIDKYIRQYDLGDVLCFATDYPHVEGGKDPMVRAYEKLKPFGDEVLMKFFVTNAQWLFPE